MMRFFWLGLLLFSASAVADEELTNTRAFDQAYAASFYQFDACGDWLTGRAYREALTAKVRQCPFSADAKSRYQARSAAQRRKSSEAIAKLIDDNGGLPMRLEGMTRTCREQIESPDYQALRGKLEAVSAGTSGVDAVVPQPCDAAEITP
jgi:hypothetical protein